MNRPGQFERLQDICAHNDVLRVEVRSIRDFAMSERPGTLESCTFVVYGTEPFILRS